MIHGKDIIERLDLSHCLRPEYTKSIIQTLIRDRNSIDLIGQRGAGKTRLLEDIRECKLPGIHIVTVNLKEYVENFGGLLREIHRQLGLNGEVPAKLDRLFDGLDNRETFYLVFLDNYDALLENIQKDDGYDANFIDDLNFIKKKENVRLLCATAEAHNKLLFFVKNESHRNSWLNLELEHLPALTAMQIQAEMERRLGISRAQLEKQYHCQYKILENRIHNQELPYARLQALVKKLRRQTEDEQNIKFEKRLQKWLEEFEEDNKKSLLKQIHGVKTGTVSTVRASGLDKIKIPFQSIGDWIGKLFGK